MSQREITICVLAFSFFTICASPQSRNDASKNEQPKTVADTLTLRHIGLSKQALLEALHGPDAEIRGLAALQLSATRGDDVKAQISEALDRETLSATRTDMAVALTWLGSIKGSDVLRGTCNSPAEPSSLRLQAALYLLNVEDGSCLKAVMSLVETDTESSVQMMGLSLLPRFKGASEGDTLKIYGLCVRALGNTEPAVRLAESSALVAMGNSSGIADLQRAIASEGDEVVRKQMKDDLYRLQQKVSH